MRKKNRGASTKLIRFRKTKRPTYHQDWAAYNEGQTREKEMVERLLHDLCEGIVQPKHKMGRHRIGLPDMIFSGTMKVYGTRSGRRSISDLRECGKKNLLAEVPHYNTVFKYLKDKSLTFILKSLIQESAKPLAGIEEDFAIDSTGFSPSTYSRWLDERDGKNVKQHDWIKLHIMMGVRTHIVTAAEVTDSYGRDTHDNTQFPGLVESTAKAFNIKEISADKAYLSMKNFDLVENVGATPYILFKKNTTGKGSALWKKMYFFFQTYRDEYLRNYHKRSNAESTMWMIKSKFGNRIRSKLPTSKKNELLLKVLCHNLSVLVQSYFELGITAPFWKEAA